MQDDAQYQPVPVDAAKQIATGFQKSVVVILCFDRTHQRVHTTTYGVAPTDKDWAAEWGEIATRAIGTDLDQKISYEDYRRVGASAAAELRAAQEQRAKLFAACQAAHDLLLRCDAETRPNDLPYATDEEWDAVAEQLAAALHAAAEHVRQVAKGE